MQPMGKKRKKGIKDEDNIDDDDDSFEESETGFGDTDEEIEDLETGTIEKPLRLVLRVGAVQASQLAADSKESSEISDAEETPRLKHKKKKKKRRHEHHEKKEKRRNGDSDDVKEPAIQDNSVDVKEEYLEDDDDIATAKCDASDSFVKSEAADDKPDDVAEKAEATIASVLVKRSLFNESDYAAERNLRERSKLAEEKAPLTQCLNYLQRILQRKDVNGFFSFPVTDQIAPGYSQIIKHPMDFSTMKTKIDNSQYCSLTEYRNDLKQMCDNCMMYNHDETIFYKEARKLWATASKQISKESILQMLRNLPFMSNMTCEELGLPESDLIADGATICESSQGNGIRFTYLPSSKQRKISSKFEAVPDKMSAEEILTQAEAAADEAAERLDDKYPRSKIGYLSKGLDGKTTMLNILNSENDGIVSEKEKVVTLGQLTGKLHSGIGCLGGFREDKRNKATPVTYLSSYGAFSSYAPIFDSSTANLSKDESDLLLSTYGDEVGVQYAYSIQHFVENCGDYAVKWVDNLLDVLTSGEHSRTMATLHEKEEEITQIQEQKPDEKLLSEQSIGVNTSSACTGVNGATKSPESSGLKDNNNAESLLQSKLKAASNLLGSLQNVQCERLSQRLPVHLSLVQGPSQNELQIADKVTNQLTELIQVAHPGDVISDRALHKAMGVTLVTTTTPPPSVTSDDRVSDDDHVTPEPNENDHEAISSSDPIKVGHVTSEPIEAGYVISEPIEASHVTSEPIEAERGTERFEVSDNGEVEIEQQEEEPEEEGREMSIEGEEIIDLEEFLHTPLQHFPQLGT